MLQCVMLMLCCAGCRNKDLGKTLKEIFQTPYFRVVVVPDEETVELCGALKVRYGPFLMHTFFCH